MTMEAFGDEFGEDDPRYRGSAFDPAQFGEDSWEVQPGWLDERELAETRGRVPMLYVEALPVRIDHLGRVGEVGLLLRGSSTTGLLSRSLVSGRVLHGERIRDALLRNLEKDLGTSALPQLPLDPVPHAIAEYFPWPGERFHDPRQHAISLAFVVVVTGDCSPRQDALEVSWLTPAEAVGVDVAAELEGGRATLVRQLLDAVGALD